MEETWQIFSGSKTQSPSKIWDLPPPPPWRAFKQEPGIRSHEYFGYPSVRKGEETGPEGASAQSTFAATSYEANDETVAKVNTALYLRRPLLVTGPPGSGKSTLAEVVAHELRLGDVLTWAITSRVTLRDGLYRYDPIGRLYSAQENRAPREPGRLPENIGAHIRLGPLGTALLPFDVPRVLLIDEIDKSDIDLPNDLLTIFEKGYYEIPELMRAQTASDRERPHSGTTGEKGAADEDQHVTVMTADGTRVATIESGRVQCHAFPLVIMTSNGERTFPPAFIRRCIKLQLDIPRDKDKLGAIVRNHLELDAPTRAHGKSATGSAELDALIDSFLKKMKKNEQLATDQLLNAAYMSQSVSGKADEDTRERITDQIMHSLNEIWEQT
ncbi:hypothetical protein BJF83_20510 [Nocardiopsis sp. CNR-923]|nr:hypothetical protein BJF83_20510 [Nocardiopsis sp. CNR-923]